MRNMFTPKTVADLDTYFGKALAKTVRSFRKADYRRLPTLVHFTDKKPMMPANGTQWAYAVNLQTATVTNERYCGSSLSTMHHPEQLEEGFCPPTGYALIFVEASWNGRNLSWVVTVVSQDLIKQLPEVNA